MNAVSQVGRFIGSGVKLLATACVLLVAVNYLVGTIDLMPGYAAVYLDDQERIYLAPGCLKEWEGRKSDTLSFLRLSTAKEAFSRKYEADEACRQAGWFAQDGPGIVRIYAVRWGLLPPVRHWWDEPYRTDDGSIIYPNGGASN